MSNRRKLTKWWLICAAPVLLLAAVMLSFRKMPGATPSAVAISFLGYTNAPNTDRRFALFSISNQAPFSVRWYGDTVEVEGIEYHKGRTVNASLPGSTYEPVLSSHGALVMAVGEPFYQNETGRWRFSMTFSRYGFREKWFGLSRKHNLPLRVGPIQLIDDQEILSSTNHAQATSPWLTK